MKAKEAEQWARGLTPATVERGRSRYRRDYGRRVGYNSTTLGKVVAQMRNPDSGNPKIPINRNLAAARLSNGRTLTGVSGKNGDSEIDIINQLDEINRDRQSRGESRLTITHVYSERQPCAGCQGALQQVAPRAEVQWSVEYSAMDNPTDIQTEDMRVLNARTRLELMDEVSDAMPGIRAEGPKPLS